MAGAPSLLLCLHDDFELHFESEGSAHEHCEDGHDHVTSQEVELCVVNEGCTDLELHGSELIPSRLNEVHSVDLPILALAEFNFHDMAVSKVETLSTLLPPVRGPPISVHWLTDLYIQKTVLRV